jgi:putative oxidoreductase
MLLKFLGKYRDFGLLVLRLGLGIAFMIHGLPKLGAGPKMWHGLGEAMGNLGIHFWPTFWGFMAAATEGIGGLLLILGVFYRPICLLLAFRLVVATLSLAHSAWTIDAFNKGFSRPMELAVVFFGLAFVGPGRFSIDKD